MKGNEDRAAKSRGDQEKTTIAETSAALEMAAGGASQTAGSAAGGEERERASGPVILIVDDVEIDPPGAGRQEPITAVIEPREEPATTTVVSQANPAASTVVPHSEPAATLVVPHSEPATTMVVRQEPVVEPSTEGDRQAGSRVDPPPTGEVERARARGAGTSAHAQLEAFAQLQREWEVADVGAAELGKQEGPREAGLALAAELKPSPAVTRQFFNAVRLEVLHHSKEQLRKLTLTEDSVAVSGTSLGLKFDSCLSFGRLEYSLAGTLVSPMSHRVLAPEVRVDSAAVGSKLILHFLFPF